MGEIKCTVLYVFGGTSDVSTKDSIRRKMESTGKGDAEMIIVEEAGHLVPQEEVDKSGILLKIQDLIPSRCGSTIYW